MKDRQTSQPGGCECNECGAIFIGGPQHDVCGECAALAAQPGAVALTGKQRVMLAQAWTMLEDYAEGNRRAGNDSFADGAEASAHEIKLMLAAAPTEKPAQQDAVDAEQIEVAAKELSRCLDYPWAPMSATGKKHMRETAESVIRAAISAKKGGQV